MKALLLLLFLNSMATAVLWRADTTQKSETLIPNEPLHITWVAMTADYPNRTEICHLAILSFQTPILIVVVKQTYCQSGSDTLIVPVTPLNSTLKYDGKTLYMARLTAGVTHSDTGTF